MTIYFVDTNLIATIKMSQGDQLSQAVDFNSTNVTVSSVAWSVERGSTVSISGTPSLSSGVSTGTIVAGGEREGPTLVKVKATFSDGQIKSQHIKFDVIDPDCTQKSIW